MNYQYLKMNFRPSTLEMIKVINSIIAEYREEGFTLTVRQLYYQMVSRDIISNALKEYKMVSRVINDGKLAGLIDWDMLEDRTRSFKNRNRFINGADVLEAAASSFHLDMWEDQEYRVFCIVEKEALFGVLNRACSKWDIPLLAARGYPSGTVLREFVVDRIAPNSHQFPIILHLGDHDPSGIDMTRDLVDRIEVFTEGEIEFELHRLALNIDQVKQYKPPENPAKLTDSRIADYSRKFGKSSWELDALEPRVLNALIEKKVESLIDFDLWTAKANKTKETKEKIRDFSSNFKD